MKKLSISLISREMQNKTTMRYYLILLSLEHIRKQNNQCWGRWGGAEPLTTDAENVNWFNLFWKTRF